MVWVMIAGIMTIITASVLAMMLFPVMISVDSVRSGGKVKGDLSIRWLMLLIRYTLKDDRMELFIFSRRIGRLPQGKKPLETKEKKPGKSRVRPSVGVIYDLAGPMLRLLKDIIAVFRLKYFDIDVTYGLEEPAYTGIMTGFLHAAKNSLRLGHGVSFTPDFNRRVLDWNVRTKVSITPIRILPPLVRFVASRRVIRSGWRIIRG